MQLKDFFEKKFEFAGNNFWKLPETAFESPTWSIKSQLLRKAKLNEVKSLISSHDILEWTQHTKFRDPAGFVIGTLRRKYNPQLLTQAWCKFYECVSQYPHIIPDRAIDSGKLTSLHLCEAPGAFISSLNHYLCTHYPDLKWNWLANTLNPYHEGNPLNKMIPDDRLIKNTLDQWDFGLDNTGDIMQNYNRLTFINRIHGMQGKVWLITADGSVDCSGDPGEQEHSTHHLHYCEAVTALELLEPGGTFVLKIFTIFEHQTISLLYLLNCIFKSVTVFKPCTSKSGNSEVYIICLRYKGKQHLETIWISLLRPYSNPEIAEQFALFDVSQIDEQFLKQLEACCDLFMWLQIKTISLNLKMFAEGNSDKYCLIKRKKRIANFFIDSFEIADTLPKQRKLQVGNIQLISKSSDNVEFKIKIGKRVNKVFSLRFCEVINENSPINHSLLFTTAFNCLCSNFDIAIVDRNCFASEIDQGLFQKQFFYRLKEKALGKSYIAIVDVVFSTKLLADLLYLLLLGYDRHIFLNNNRILIVADPNNFKLELVKRYFNVIDAIYIGLDHCESLEFVPDLLQVLPNSVVSDHFLETMKDFNNKR